MVKHFRELRVYREAFEAAMQIFEYSKAWPREERYSLTDQIRRSSRSVCEQIAEAWRKRRYIAHFRSKLTDADSEAAETQTWLEFALKCGYLTQDLFAALDAAYERIIGGLVNMMDHADQWCVSNSQVREDQMEYEAPAPLTTPHTPILTHPQPKETDMDWIQNFPVAVVMCDTKGILTYLNDAAAAMYEPFGGRALLGKCIFDCHKQQSSIDKIHEIMRTRKPHAYTTERKGVKRLIYQAPHVVNDEVVGIIELAIIIPFEMPHFVRG